MQEYKPLFWLHTQNCQGSADSTQTQAKLTFALKALFSQDADEGQELGDLFQVEHGGVVELDDRHRLLVVGTAAAVLPQTVAGNNST